MSSEKRKSHRRPAKSTSSHAKRPLSNYHKRQMLLVLKESDCHPKDLPAMVARFKVDENDIKGKWTPDTDMMGHGAQ